MSRRKRPFWTRSRYRAAASLRRFSDRHPYDRNWDDHPLLRAFNDLWDQHPQREDPLLLPRWMRYLSSNEIPF